MFIAPVRSGSSPVRHRLAYVGDLSRGAGAADVLISMAGWAEHHPDQPAEIWWIGEGDLASVLAEQPLPKTLSQSFRGQLDRAAMLRAFEQCNLLVVSSNARGGPSVIPDALAMGLPILGSRRSAMVRKFIRHNVNGWHFDPERPGHMLATISAILEASAGGLNRVRQAGPGSIELVKPVGGGKRLRHALLAALSARRLISADSNVIGSDA